MTTTLDALSMMDHPHARANSPWIADLPPNHCCRSHRINPSKVASSNWLLSTSSKLGLLPDSIAIAYSILHRSWDLISSHASPLLHAGVCIYLACKYMEVSSPAMEAIFSFLLPPTESPRIRFLDSVTRIRIQSLEILILRELDYRIRSPSLTCFPACHTMRMNRIFYYLFFYSHLDPEIVTQEDLGGICDSLSYKLGVQASAFTQSEERVLKSVVRLTLEFPEFVAVRRIFMSMRGSLTELHSISAALL